MPRIFIRAGAIRASIRVSYFISLIIYYTDINPFLILQTDVGLNEDERARVRTSDVGTSDVGANGR